MVSFSGGYVMFWIYCSLSEPQRVRGDWCQNSRQNFALLSPPTENLEEGWARGLSEFDEFGLQSIVVLWYTLGVTTVRCLEN